MTKTPITPDEIEEAMIRCVEDPLSLTPRDIDAVIHYVRNAAINAASGGARPKKNRGTIDLDKPISLGDLDLRPKVTVKGTSSDGLKKI